MSSGLGRAHVFMSQKHYQSQFKAVLGVGAWPGTLNVDVGSDSLGVFSRLRVLAGLEEGDANESAEPLKIEGFERDGRSFGGATAFRGRIRKGDANWEGCAILIPDLTRHTSTAEVISGAFLRESLPCLDGDLVEIDLNSA
ncbi:MAG: CTP-dependent riboflavin kinase [Candidatus Thalassarchaeaceae archaeon]|nr:CTP-dependent riboflavin kinase [Candidatus Thalassarchaeaceae archaeon]